MFRMRKNKFDISEMHDKILHGEFDSIFQDEMIKLYTISAVASYSFIEKTYYWEKYSLPT